MTQIKKQKKDQGWRGGCGGVGLWAIFYKYWTLKFFGNCLSQNCKFITLFRCKTYWFNKSCTTLIPLPRHWVITQCRSRAQVKTEGCSSGRTSGTYKPTSSNKHEMPQQKIALSPWQPLNRQRVKGTSSQNKCADDSGAGAELNVYDKCWVVSCKRQKGSGYVGQKKSRRSLSPKSEIYKSGLHNPGQQWGEIKALVNGVGVMMLAELADSVIEIDKHNDKIVKIKMVVVRNIWNCFSLYAIQAGRSDQDKIEFWRNFRKNEQISES